MVSVIIAAYNSEKYIERALESVFSQTLPSQQYEVVAVNDGSTDSTLEILQRYEPRIRVISQSNKGVAGAYNRGIREAKGDYLVRLDADDYFAREILSATLDSLEKTPECHCVYTDRYEITAGDNHRVRVSVGENNIFDMVGCGIMFRKEVFDRVGLYRDLLFEEYDFMLRFFDHGFKGCYLAQPLYYYFRHEQGMTSQANYWKSGWYQLSALWDEAKLKKYIDIQLKLKGTTKFSTR